MIMPEIVRLVVRCGLCGTDCELTVPADEWEAYTNGKFIQDALRSLTDDERELLLSRTCDSCWKRIFRDENEY